MALIVEDGSLVAGANTWVTEAQLDAHADERGVTITGDAEQLLLKAADYINSLESRLKGVRVERDQATAYPRHNVTIEGWSWGSTEIPRQVINAQIALALEIDAGQDIYNRELADLPVISERVEGAVAVQYADPGENVKINKTRPSEVHIRSLLKHNGMSLVHRA